MTEKSWDLLADIARLLRKYGAEEFKQLAEELRSGEFREALDQILTETEYDMLGIRLDVNEAYELEIKNGSLTLKPTEGV